MFVSIEHMKQGDAFRVIRDVYMYRHGNELRDIKIFKGDTLLFVGMYGTSLMFLSSQLRQVVYEHVTTHRFSTQEMFSAYTTPIDNINDEV